MQSPSSFSLLIVYAFCEKARASPRKEAARFVYGQVSDPLMKEPPPT